MASAILFLPVWYNIKLQDYLHIVVVLLFYTIQSYWQLCQLHLHQLGTQVIKVLIILSHPLSELFHCWRHFWGFLARFPWIASKFFLKPAIKSFLTYHNFIKHSLFIPTISQIRLCLETGKMFNRNIYNLKLWHSTQFLPLISEDSILVVFSLLPLQVPKITEKFIFP